MECSVFMVFKHNNNFKKVLYLGDWVVGVCALSCCEIGTEDHLGHVYRDSHTLDRLSHGLFRTHCDVQPPRGTGLKETDILPHIYRDCYQTMRGKVTGLIVPR